MSRCYIMHVNSGSEWSVVKTLREFIAERKMENLFDMIVVPEQLVKKVELNKQKKQTDDAPVDALTQEIEKLHTAMVEGRKASKALAFDRELAMQLQNKLIQRSELVSKSSYSAKKLMPGYIVVQMEMTNDTWQLVKSVPKVIGFLGVRQDAIPSKASEIEEIFSRMFHATVVGNVAVKVTYEVGEKVRVIDGPFSTFVGQVEDVDNEKGRLKVSVSIFGRATSVELSSAQVEKEG
ncbi:MAG: transcription termination/antitermination protein NusG [Alphaproteobacteria bacterium]|nr:transcription termination/antitermination protein NusG [Alphaproteobacteria bacterium]